MARHRKTKHRSKHRADARVPHHPRHRTTTRRAPRSALVTGTVAAGLLLTAVVAEAHEVHVVKPGDTLSHIAAANGFASWQELYALNKDTIADPDLIFPGQVVALEPETTSGKPKKAKPDKSKPEATVPNMVRPATGRVTSRYGMRTHPITGVHKLHTGTDYGYGDGKARAAKAGKVTGAAWVSGNGNMVTVDHGGGVVTRYAHLARFAVSVGQSVKAGQILGDIGQTGLATGPHLHFEVLKGGAFVNPESWLAGAA